MTSFRLLLVAIIVIVGGYTAFVVVDHGWNFLQVYFNDIAKMEWPGQFNMDFAAFLILGSTWLMWRQNFHRLVCFLGLLFSHSARRFCAPICCSQALKPMVMSKSCCSEKRGRRPELAL